MQNINEKPMAVILDYNEFLRLKEIEEDKEDYYSTLKVKLNNQKWTSHEPLLNELGLVS